MKQVLQNAIKLQLFDERIIFNRLLFCSCSTTYSIFSWRANKLFNSNRHWLHLV